MQLKRCLVVLLAVFVAFQATGCGGPGKADVSGTVTLDGTPVHAGTIVFFPAQGSAISAEIKGGNYTALQVPRGEVKATVDNNDIKGMVRRQSPNALNSRGTGGDMPEGSSPEVKAAFEKRKQESAERAQRSKELIDNYRPIPEKYNDPDKSNLKFTVGRGPNLYDVPLTSQ
jgi:hypothetical protein